MKKTRNYKFRLYPTYGQQKKLQNNIDVCRWLYNHFVESVQHGFLSRNDMNYMLTELKQSEPWLYDYNAKMLQMVSTQLDAAQKILKQLCKNGCNTGSLRFAKYGDYRVFTYNQKGYVLEKHGNKDFLWLSKIGWIKIRRHRNFLGKIKQITISKSKTGKWHACVCVDLDCMIPQIDFKRSVGLDVGIKNYAYDSDGHSTPNILNLQKMLRPLAKANRTLSRRKMGSNNKKRALRWYQIIHERIANRRKDFLHKLSNQYTKKYSVVFVERLHKLNMVKNDRLSRAIMDSAWGTFTNMLDYKSMLIEVPAKNTTVDCSRCGTKVQKSLAIRTHECSMCGLILDRDHNASLNILKKGLQLFHIELPQELREVTPVKISEMSMKQEHAIEVNGRSHIHKQNFLE